MNDTPRTDAVLRDRYANVIDFARQLERDLEQAEDNYDSEFKARNQACIERDKLKRELADANIELEQLRWRLKLEQMEQQPSLGRPIEDIIQTNRDRHE